MRPMDCTPRVEEVKNASGTRCSSAIFRWTSVTSTSSITSSLVTPARQPVSRGGVYTAAPSVQKMLVPVPSLTRPRVSANMASVAPSARAWRRASTFSA